MKNINVCLLAAVACTYSIQVSANSLDNNLNFVLENNVYSLHSSSAASHTVTPLELKPILSFNSGVKLAAVCAVANGGCDGMGFSSGNKDYNLDNAAQCRDEGFGTSCGYGYVPDLSNKCPYNSSFYKCRVCSHSCSSGSLTYCNSQQVEISNAKNDCNETCYTCRAKTCEEGGYASSINSCQKATAVSYAGKTCYTSVSGKNCGDGGYSASIPANQTCSSTSYCGNTCYHSCSQPTCSVGGFRDAIPTNQTCTSTTYYGRTCYKDCYTPNCGAGGYNASIPSNNLCSSVSYYGQTCYNNCYQPQCSAGGYLASCPANHSCTTTSYYGRTCYTDGGQPSCSTGGYNSSIPANNLCSSTTYYGQTCYHSCYQPQCSAGGFEASIPSGKTCTATSYYGRTCYKDCKVNDPCADVVAANCSRGYYCSSYNCGKCVSCAKCDSKFKYDSCILGQVSDGTYTTPEFASCDSCGGLYAKRSCHSNTFINSNGVCEYDCSNFERCMSNNGNSCNRCISQAGTSWCARYCF